MNWELLELSNEFKRLEDNGLKISLVIESLASEFAELEEVSVKELLFKL